MNTKQKGLTVFEKYLSGWVFLCIILGILLGKFAPDVAKFLNGIAIYVGEAPVISIPIAVCLFFMMYPIMVKIDFTNDVRNSSVEELSCRMYSSWYRSLYCHGFSLGIPCERK